MNNGNIEVTININNGPDEQAVIDFQAPSTPRPIDCLTTTGVVPIVETFEFDLDFQYALCINLQQQFSNLYAQIEYDHEINDLISTFANEQNCLEGQVETFSATYQTTEHHYTLYYYDQAGNIVQTVPPVGIDMNYYDSAINPDGSWDDQLAGPDHKEKTRYHYNSLGQVVWQYSPDGGENRFRYDWAQRLRISEDARQKVITNFSYTKYDELGRITEVGELVTNSAAFSSVSETLLNDVNFPNNGLAKQDVTLTVYDIPTIPDVDFTQENLRNRVSVTTRLNDNGGADIVTRYSYDEHGNVTSLHHRILGFNDANGNNYAQQTDYEYDLISGNVKEVAYQKGKEDEFYHRYEYDADNRLTHAYTSEDGVIWEKDARYFYYQHGPMARTELGHDKVQGQDYFYTLQGWIKGVNLTGGSSYNQEMGKDGSIATTNNIHVNMARDAMAYTLNYHEEDYDAIGTMGTHMGSWATATSSLASYLPKKEDVYGLFNGNIAMMVTDLKGLDSSVPNIQGMVYNYDQLHRIKNAKGFSPGEITWNVHGGSSFNYHSNYKYDANGNLTFLNRHRRNLTTSTDEWIDQLEYEYEHELPSGGRQNRLMGVLDISTSSANAAGLPTGQTNSNYDYDEIGNLIQDLSEGIPHGGIVWDTYGKVKEVNFISGSNKPSIKYTYDASGNRLTKELVGVEKLFYVRDASGNVMSIYKKDSSNNAFTQKDVHLSGSSRLGQRTFDNKILFTNTPSTEPLQRTRGRKFLSLIHI